MPAQAGTGRDRVVLLARGFEYVAPHWQLDGFGRWEYIPGRWFRL